MATDEERAEVLEAATDVLEYAVDRTAKLGCPEAACAFALAVATAGAALGSLTRTQFIDMMNEVWDNLDTPTSSTPSDQTLN